MSMLPQQQQSERQRKDAQMPLVYRGRSLIKTAKKQRTMLTLLNALGESGDGEEGGGVDRTDGGGPPWTLSDGERVKDTATMSVKRKNARWTGFHGTRNISPTKSPSCSSSSFCSEISPSSTTTTTTTMLAFPNSSSTFFSSSSRVRRVPSVSSASPRTLPSFYRSSSSSSSSLSSCLFHILVVIVIVITSSTLIEGSNDLM